MRTFFKSSTKKSYVSKRAVLGLLIVSLLGIGIVAMIFTNQNNLRSESPINITDIHSFVEDQLNLGPRIPGSEGSLAFRDWIIDQIPSEWSITIQNFTYLGVECRNYIITSSTLEENNYPDLLIGAHYDTRRIADQDNTNPQSPVPGANDGGSGVAAILELLDHIAPEYQDQVGFLLFDAEDQGSGGMEGWNWIVGSTYYVENMSNEQGNATDAFVLLDMIGDDELILEYEGYSDEVLREDIWDTGIDLGYDDIFKKRSGYSLIDDHRPFLARGIPAVDLIDFNYPEWHTTDDDIDAISAENIAIVTDTIYSWIPSFLSQNSDLSSEPASSESNTNEVHFNSLYVILLAMPIIIRKLTSGRPKNHDK